MSSKILMIEHDTDDRWLTEETFQTEGLTESIDFLYRPQLTEYLDDPDNRPPLIIFSLGSTFLEDLQLIKHLRALKGFDGIPIVVLGESTHPSLIASCYAAGATSFIQKPSSHTEALFKIRSFINYWLRTVELPAI